jgi:hypothetical protein
MSFHDCNWTGVCVYLVRADHDDTVKHVKRLLCRRTDAVLIEKGSPVLTSTVKVVYDESRTKNFRVQRSSQVHVDGLQASGYLAGIHRYEAAPLPSDGGSWMPSLQYMHDLE